jgi:NADPH-dependent ferric siderophore reductase
MNHAAASGPKRRPTPRRITVARVQALSPAMRRVTFHGPDLANFGPPAPAGYIKLVFPSPGQDEAVPPTPDGPKPASMRTYTPRRYDPAALELDVDFVLHGEGPASAWARQAQPAQVLYMMGPGPGYKPDPSATTHWLIGDDTAMPAIETILLALQAHSTANVYAEVVSADEQRSLDTAVSTEVHWLSRGDDPARAGTALETALRGAAPPPQGTRVYLACEASAMRRLRKLLIDELGVAKSHVVGRGYWKLGTVNHPDHDYGED